VKRGLKPREEAGPILEEGKSYTLVIDRRWPDAKGNPLAVDYRKSFKVGPPDDEPPDPRRWQLKPPAAGTSAALVVRFPKPLDHGLLHRFLSVAGPAGRMVAGKILVTNEETGWHFTPERPWQAGNYRLVVDRTLEDLAGNTIGKPFEVDVFRQVTRQIKTENISLPFTIR
jgi:hypothetical protein